ncbi:hypothetical protein KFL_002130020 [Klebsormidium nitens]|uniref:Chromatin modification-related protein MEAF6 n=1 Tax=Klebsormidium nitens TaxID=105231 RepID=A0A1Y1I1X8_KLENI|nr:hypothetical protein KFL_002130020 [Klebsormidium nitens]|eukprot:GAQ84925.1 hypothetical protein KFL_002130020 [Klebsormidium nitens]
MTSAARAPGAGTGQSTLTLLMQKKEKLEDELRGVEKQVYDLETTYLDTSSSTGNVLKGFDGFLSNSKSVSKRSRGFKVEDRLFSLSSITSPAVQELEAAREESKLEQIEKGQRPKGLLPGSGTAKGRKPGPKPGTHHNKRPKHQMSAPSPQLSESGPPIPYDENDVETYLQ